VRDFADGGTDGVVDDEQVVIGFERELSRVERALLNVGGTLRTPVPIMLETTTKVAVARPKRGPSCSATRAGAVAVADTIALSPSPRTSRPVATNLPSKPAATGA
jgi:hypothetical protein